MNYPLQTVGFKTETDIESYRFVSAQDDLKVAQASGGAAYISGVTTDVKTTGGNVCDVVTNGISKVEYGGTVAAKGLPLTADSLGRAVVATSNGDYIGGYSLEAGTEGDLCTFDIQKSQLVVPA